MPEEEKLSSSARFGLVLFVVYVLLYGGFMALTVLSPATMARVGPGGINVAVAYGMVLILAAFLLAIIYMLGCRD